MKNQVITHIFCDVCGQQNWSSHRHPGLIICDNCSLVRAEDNLSSKDLTQYYTEKYFFGNEYFDYFQERTALEKNFSMRISQLEKLITLKESSLIDIGSSYGFFLNLIHTKVKSSIGFDITVEGIQYAKEQFNLDCRNQDFLAYTGDKVEIITMWDVIEHLANPNEIIEHVSSKLDSNGILMLTTGDIGTISAQLQGNKWRLIHPPTHMFYFSKETITKLLHKHQFEIISITYPWIYRNLGTTIQAVIGKKFPHITSLASRYLSNISFPFNMYDIMLVVAKKKSV